MEVWNRNLLIAHGGWEDVQRASESVRHVLLNEFVDKHAIPASRGVAYWQSLATGGIASAGLFYVQNSPIYVRDFAHEPRFTWRPHFRFNVGIPKLRSTHWDHGLLAWIVGEYRSITGAFLHPMQTVASAQSKKLTAQRDDAASRIGKLLRGEDQIISKDTIVVGSGDNDGSSIGVGDGDIGPGSGSGSGSGSGYGETDTTSSQQAAQAAVKQLAEVSGVSDIDVSSPEQALNTLQLVLDSVGKHAGHGSNLSATPSVPPMWIRYWPAAALGAYAAFKVAGSWQELASWFKVSVMQTAAAFWRNWVVEPLYKIYLTIRHDPNGQVALMAKESLTTDVDSLENMVTDFVRDSNPGLSADALAQVRSEARNGNLTPVLSVYENQIKSPVTNLVTGKLLRTMLIQVQKTKVDAEVALSGIDQLLQSQQLVFGVVAALPALAAVAWLGTIALLWLSGKQESKIASRLSDTSQRLLNLDNILQQAPSILRDADVGLVYCEVVMIRHGLHPARSVRAQRLERALDTLLTHAIESRDTAAALVDLDRVYIRAGH